MFRFILVGTAIAVGVWYVDTHAASPAGQEVFDRLQTAAGTNIDIQTADVPGSYASAEGIRISYGHIEMCERRAACIASITAHEIGHHVLGHLSGPASKKKEYEADIYGVRLMFKVGYDCMEAPKTMWRYLDIYGDVGGPVHPKPSVRIRYMTKECKKLQGTRRWN